MLNKCIKKIIKFKKITIISIIIASILLSLVVVNINLNITPASPITKVVKGVFLYEASAAAVAAIVESLPVEAAEGAVVSWGGKLLKFVKGAWVPAAVVGGAYLAGPQLATAGLFLLLGWIVYLLAYVVGGILLVLVSILGQVVNYNGFIDVPTVVTGWVIVRDISNMLFVLILLAIAFATILRIPSYEMKKALPKLLIMAVLINFSRTICGIIIDASQVVMATFIGAFSGGIDGSFIKLFMVDSYLTSLKSMAGAGSGWESLGIAASVIAGFIALTITTIALLVLVLVLIMRIIMLWIYVVMSPLAYALSAFPAGQKYAQQWWSEFIKQVTTGPILAFFLWLALLTAQQSSVKLIDSAKLLEHGAGTVLEAKNQTISTNDNKSLCGNSSDIFCVNNLQTYIIVIGMLIGGLLITQQAGGAAGAMAGKGMAWIQSGKGLRGMTTIADFINRKQDKGFQFGKWKVPGTGIDFNLARVGKTLKAKWEDQKRKDLLDMQQRSGEVMATKNRFWGALAMTGNVGDAWDKISTFKGIKHIIMGGASLEEKNKEYEEKLKQAKARQVFLKSERHKFWNKEERDKADSGILELDQEIDFLDNDIEKEGKELAKEQTESVPNLRSIDNIKNRITNLKNQRAEKRQELIKLVGHQQKWNPQEGQKAMLIDKDIAEASSNIGMLKEEAAEYAPMYQFEARVAERKAVSEEKSKIKDIDDSDELVRMLRDSIRQRDKSKVKALVEKLTEDANDNEFTEALVPWEGSGYEGVQQLMDALAGKINAQYEAELRKKYKDKGYSDGTINDYLKHLRSLNAGFSEQEAYSLGAQVAETNKRTNHWEATAAYVVDNGKFRKTSDEEHVLIASTEFGKRNPQANQRDNNRLAYGKHFYDAEGNKQYNMTKIGVIMLQSYDNDRTINRTGENMNESAAKFLTPYAKKMEEQGMLRRTDEKGKTLSTRMEEKANKALINFGVRYQTISDELNNLLK